MYVSEDTTDKDGSLSQKNNNKYKMIEIQNQ